MKCILVKIGSECSEIAMSGNCEVCKNDYHQFCDAYVAEIFYKKYYDKKYYDEKSHKKVIGETMNKICFECGFKNRKQRIQSNLLH